MSQLHQLNTGDPKEVTPSEFFNDVCPKILEVQKDACQKLGGSYGIQLFGETGGAWTLDFTQASINDGIRDGVDFYLEMDASDFSTMMKGILDIEEAAKGGRIRFEGNAAMFGNLAAILQPAD